MAGPAPHTLPGYSESGPWFYNSISGEVHHATGVGALAYEAATRLPGDWYGFKTEADVVSAARAEGWPAPTTSVATGLGNEATTASSNAAGDLLGLPKFQNTRGFAVRAFKVVVGVGLILAGVSIIGKSAGVSVPKAVPIPV